MTMPRFKETLQEHLKDSLTEAELQLLPRGFQTLDDVIIVNLKNCILILFVLCLSFSCGGEIMSSDNQYSVEIGQIESSSDNRIKVYFRAMSETLYYCPGANARVSDGETDLVFVRCSIRKECEVTHPADNDEHGSFIVVRDPPGPIFVTQGQERVQIYP